MIALRNYLPLVRGSEGNAIALEIGWLQAVVLRAAGRAGYQGWLLADDFVAGISLYLRDCYRKNVIDLPELESVVRVALQSVGYAEVASRIDPGLS